jgi:hypothetical protein
VQVRQIDKELEESLSTATELVYDALVDCGKPRIHSTEVTEVIKGVLSTLYEASEVVKTFAPKVFLYLVQSGVLTPDEGAKNIYILTPAEKPQEPELTPRAAIDQLMAKVASQAEEIRKLTAEQSSGIPAATFDKVVAALEAAREENGEVAEALGNTTSTLTRREKEHAEQLKAAQRNHSQELLRVSTRAAETEEKLKAQLEAAQATVRRLEAQAAQTTLDPARLARLKQLGISGI